MSGMTQFGQRIIFGVGGVGDKPIENLPAGATVEITELPNCFTMADVVLSDGTRESWSLAIDTDGRLLLALLHTRVCSRGLLLHKLAVMMVWPLSVVWWLLQPVRLAVLRHKEYLKMLDNYRR